jgi:thiamine pyrophosphate-dependent acetolactate synthase large subunit-like protein
MNGGQIIAKVLAYHKVKYLFTLCGGHISPIFVGAKQEGIQVIDTRHEANAVFAADAVARITGEVGVAAVTAGPGVTNTITAIKNAQMAQSPIVLLGGAAATVLKGRGSLQDIDQLSVMKSITKWCVSVKKVKDFATVVHRAFHVAKDGVPGPVFIECPIDLLYDEKMVKSWYLSSAKKDASIAEKAIQWYLEQHVESIFDGSHQVKVGTKPIKDTFKDTHSESQINVVRRALATAERPIIVFGSGSMLQPKLAEQLASALCELNVPIYLSGMARGLLGKNHGLQMRHNRKDALKKADVVILAGVPCDFRMDYGRHISYKSKYIGINNSREDLFKNKNPNIAILSDPAQFFIDLARGYVAREYQEWRKELHLKEAAKEIHIDQQSIAGINGINPIALFRKLDEYLPDNTTLVADGGDFVGTASYILKPRKPLSWLDPGVYGTLGVGGGFALGAKLCHPDDDIWIIYGDGSSAFSIAEIDTMVRHKLPAIILIGNDASWAQIARDQIDILHDDVATVLNYSSYEKIGEAFGARGRTVRTLEEFESAVNDAKVSLKEGVPYVINAIIAKNDFRKGSISV